MAEEFKPLHILLIEDNEHDRMAFQRALKTERIDCDLTPCQRAEEARDLLKRGDASFDLVVLDFDLPGMNGLEFFKQMRRKQDLPPFVMLTGAGSERLAVKSLQAGIYDYVVKDSGMGYLNLLPLVLTRAVQRHANDLARRSAEAALKKAHTELELKVRERTADLAMTVKALEIEIEEHRQTELALRKSQEHLRRLSHKILDAQENERKFVAQEIHDSISGSLAAIKMALEEKLYAMGRKPSANVVSLEKIISHVTEIIKESRRISAHLRPALLDDLGLLASIDWFGREFEQLHPGLKIEQQLDVTEDEIPEMLKVVIYRVLQEAMNNVAKHSGATRVRLLLIARDNRLELTVADNGCGFDPADKSSDSSAISGFGLTGIADRIQLCDGKFELLSEKGRGTTLHISLPSGPESIGASIPGAFESKTVSRQPG
ncbi:MAG: response regulator [Desulfobacterales bacterium]